MCTSRLGLGHLGVTCRATAVPSAFRFEPEPTELFIVTRAGFSDTSPVASTYADGEDTWQIPVAMDASLAWSFPHVRTVCSVAMCSSGSLSLSTQRSQSPRRFRSEINPSGLMLDIHEADETKVRLLIREVT